MEVMEALNDIAKLMGCVTWNDGAKLALARLDSHAKFNPPSVPYEVEILRTIKLVNSEEENSFDYYGDSLLNIGCSAWLGLSEIDRLDMEPLLVNRQIKYGPNNILAFQYKGIAMRMADKVARIQNGQEDFEDEAYKDAVMDLVGYCAIAMMLHDGTFHLPVQAAMFGAWEGTQIVVSDSQRQDLYGIKEHDPIERIRGQFK